MEQQQEKTRVIALEGDLSLIDVDALNASLPAPDSIDRLVINFSKVRSLDSTIIASIMSYRRRFMAAGGDPLNIVVLAGPTLRRIFELTGVSRAVTVVPSEE